MINIVIDTNILLAALIKPTGSNMAAFRCIVANRETLHICYSSQMMSEYEDVLARPVITGRGLQPEAQGILKLIRLLGEEVVPKYLGGIVYPDRKDRPFLEAAVYVHGIILTNNLRDFPFADINAVAPEEFISWCNSIGFY